MTRNRNETATHGALLLALLALSAWAAAAAGSSEPCNHLWSWHVILDSVDTTRGTVDGFDVGMDGALGVFNLAPLPPKATVSVFEDKLRAL